MLHGKARVWFGLQNSLDNFDQFREAFKSKFYTVPIQVKTKSKWLNARFNSELDTNLQTFYYSQLKQSNYIRPLMSDYEKNYSIVQQFPYSIKKALASINYNDNSAIVMALANLDAIHLENRRNFEYKRNNFQNPNKPEEIGVAQMRVYNTQGRRSNRQGRGNFHERAYNRSFGGKQ